MGAVDFFKKEYARKEERAKADFKRSIATATTKKEHSIKKAVLLGATVNLESTGEDPTKDSETPDVHMTQEQRQELKAILSGLRKHEEHEEKYASRDGQEAVDFFKEEGAKADFKRSIVAATEKEKSTEEKSTKEAAPVKAEATEEKSTEKAEREEIAKRAAEEKKVDEE